MAEKKEATEKEETSEKEPLAVTVVPGGPQQPVQPRRSETEQAIIDSYGSDPAKFKEGSRERELVESLPENIAKKREEEEKKKQ